MQTTSFLPKVVCPHALKNSTIPVGLLKTKVIKKIVWRDQDPADREKVLVAGKMEDEGLRPNSVSPHVPEELDDKTRALEKVAKKVDRHNREPADRESVLWAGEMEDGDLRPNPVPPHVPEELDDKIRALEKVAKKVDRQNREPAGRESVLWAGEMEDGDLRPKFRSPSFSAELGDKIRALEKVIRVAKRESGKSMNFVKLSMSQMPSKTQSWSRSRKRCGEK